MKQFKYPATHDERGHYGTAETAVERYLNRYPKSACEVIMADKLAYRAYGEQHPLTNTTKVKPS